MCLSDFGLYSVLSHSKEIIVVASLPTVATAIVSCMRRSVTDITYAPIYLAATLCSVDAKTTKVDLVRDGESMWSGKHYRNELQGRTDTYPHIDLSKIDWGIFDPITFEHIRTGGLRAAMQARLNTILAATPFYMVPVNPIPTPEQFENGQHSYAQPRFFLLGRPEGVPKWLVGMEQMHMAAKWKAFLPPASPELAFIEKLMHLERQRAELEHLKATPPLSLIEKEAAVVAAGQKLLSLVPQFLIPTA